MSNLDKAARDKLPASSFAMQKQRLYPILDQSDADDAVSLVGKHPEAKAGIIRRIKELKLTMPKAWQTADMSAAPEMVIKRGKLFEAGDYAGQRFSITPEEMLLAVENFTPVPVRDTHMARETSLLDGKLGTVQSISLDPNNSYDLIGEVALPRWLDDALAGTQLSVSAEWNRQTKQLAGLALLTDPQISDAAVYAAFAKAVHNTPEGQSAIQGIHDMASRAGAVCDDPATWAAKHEVSAVQQIHDIAQDNGAHCAAMAPGRSGSASPAWYAQQANTEAVNGNAVLFGAVKKESRMSKFTDALKKWRDAEFKGEPPEIDEPATQPGIVSFSATPTVSITSTSPDPEVVRLRAQVEQLTAARIQAEAVGFADGEILAHRAYPAEREALIAAFSQASYDDGAGAAQFSAGKSRVQLLRDANAARPPHALTTEQLKPEDVNALFNQMSTAQSGAPKPMTAERKSELLGMTGIGKEVLAERNGTGRN